MEPAYDRPGVRVFGVNLQDKPVIEGLDIFAKVGKNKALDYTFKDITVTDGRLRIDFTYQVEFPCIAAIVAEGPARVRKINCGGDAYKDFAADWPASTTGGRQRYLPADDFYSDWAAAQFGPEVGRSAGPIFARIDCHMPRSSDWIDGPGGVKPDPRPLNAVNGDYAFVDELAALRPLVQGAGNLERFDYWLNSFRYNRAGARPTAPGTASTRRWPKSGPKRTARRKRCSHANWPYRSEGRSSQPWRSCTSASWQR